MKNLYGPSRKFLKKLEKASEAELEAMNWVWIPLQECRVLRRKPKRIDFVIPIGMSFHLNNILPLKGWTYFAQIDNYGKQSYWKVRDRGKWAVTE